MTTLEIKRGAADLSRLVPGTEAYDAAWLGKMLSYLPERWRVRASAQHAQRVRVDGECSGNTWLRELADEMQRGAFLGLDATDADIRDAAKDLAGSLYDLACDWVTDLHGLTQIRAAAESFCAGRGVVPPGADTTDQGMLNRVFSSEWWVRRLRAAHGRRLEKHAQRMGYVSRKAGCYVSNENVLRRRDQRKRNAAAMAAAELENQFGDVFTLAELAERTNANPRIRRAELMTRISGFEAVAQGVGHAAEFWTGTAPSRFHAVKMTGERNERHDGSTARDAQAHLVKAWAQCRAAMHRRGIRPYGFRIAEPHHDGCPHWHLLLFMPAEQVEEARELFSKYFLAKHEPDERGALGNRCKFVAIDRSRGSAAGYVAKYISKNIDGFGIGSDLYGNDEVTTAERVDAWAATWGIRQFQQIGGAPVGVWRELRRIKDADGLSDVAQGARAAADAGAWAEYVAIQGGPLVKREELPLRTAYTREGEKFNPVTFEPEPAENCYGEPAAKSVYGVRDTVKGCAYLSRIFRWVAPKGERAGLAVAASRAAAEVGKVAGTMKVGPAARAARVADGARKRGGFGFRKANGRAAWTRVNNCTGGKDGNCRRGSSCRAEGVGEMERGTGSRQIDGRGLYRAGFVRTAPDGASGAAAFERTRQ